MSKPTAVGMHIYSGAWTLGFMERFEVLGQWEEGPWGASTFRHNLGKQIPHVVKPAQDWPFEDLRGREVNLVYANPPCAPWSNAGALLGMDDPRVQFSRNVSWAAAKLEPDFFVVESVCRAWSPTGGRPLYEKMALDWGARGYAVTIFLTNAFLHGAPQQRERFHFIAHRYALDLRVDPPTLATIRTARDAIGDLEGLAVPTPEEPIFLNHNYSAPKPRELNVIERLQQGEGWGVGYDRAVEEGLDAAKGRFISGRLRYDAPCSTLLDIGSVVHPTENRQLTVREGARLCCYPDWYEFPRDIRQLRGYQLEASQLTQAVLPVMGTYLGRVFNRALDGATNVEPCISLDMLKVIDVRSLARPFRSRRFAESVTALARVG